MRATIERPGFQELAHEELSFRHFLNQRHCVEALDFALMVSDYRKHPTTALRNQIFLEFIHEDALREINIPGGIRRTLVAAMGLEEALGSEFDEAELHVVQVLQMQHMPAYMGSVFNEARVAKHGLVPRSLFREMQRLWRDHSTWQLMEDTSAPQMWLQENSEGHSLKMLMRVPGLDPQTVVNVLSDHKQHAIWDPNVIQTDEIVSFTPDFALLYSCVDTGVKGAKLRDFTVGRAIAVLDDEEGRPNWMSVSRSVEISEEEVKPFKMPGAVRASIELAGYHVSERDGHTEIAALARLAYDGRSTLLSRHVMRTMLKRRAGTGLRSLVAYCLQDDEALRKYHGERRSSRKPSKLRSSSWNERRRRERIKAKLEAGGSARAVGGSSRRSQLLSRSAPDLPSRKPVSPRDVVLGALPNSK